MTTTNASGSNWRQPIEGAHQASENAKSSTLWTGWSLGVGAAVVAALGSSNPSLWSDESATISAAQRSLPDLWRMIGNVDLVHGAYYFFMHFWVTIFGISPLAVRLPSAIAVGVAAACVYWLGRRLGGSRLGIWSAVIFAILPRIFWAGTEARSYSFTAMLAVATTLVLVIALEHSSKRYWFGYSALVLAGVLCNLYLGLMLAAHLITMLWDRGITKRQRFTWLSAGAASAIISAPFLIAAAKQSAQLGDHSFGVSNFIQNVAVNQWFLGDTPTTTTGVSMTSMSLTNIGSWWVPASLLLAAISWCLMAFAVFRDVRGGDSSSRTQRKPLAWLLPWIAFPPLMIGGYSIAVSPMYSPRYLTFCAPAVAILVAIGILAIPMAWIRVSTIVVLILAAIPVYVSQREIYGKNSSDWASAAGYVAAHSASGEGVYFAPRYPAVAGLTVGQTTRGMMIAYPKDFVGLTDITAIESPAAAADLVGTSRRLKGSGPELATVNTLWVVRRKDYPQLYVGQDTEFLTSAGFHATASWAGPLDVVIEYVRSE